MKIWDLHCHMNPRWIKGDTFDRRIETALAIGERVGITRMCLFVGTSGEVSDREIVRALDKWRDRVFGFIYIALPSGVDRQIDLIERWIADGPLVGVKMGGSSGRCHLPEYDRFFARGVELGAMFYIHTWLITGGEGRAFGGGNPEHTSWPRDVAELAARYPEHPFICGHNGGDFELGTRAVRAQTNVLSEIAGGFAWQGQVEMNVRELGADRMVYGTDIPGRSFATQTAKVHGAAVSDEVKQKIFRDNLRRIMAPIATGKGYNLNEN